MFYVEFLKILRDGTQKVIGRTTLVRDEATFEGIPADWVESMQRWIRIGV